MEVLHTKLFFLIYDFLGPASLVSGFTIFLGSWLPFLVVAFALVHQVFWRDDVSMKAVLFRILTPSVLVLLFTEVVKLLAPAARPFALFDIPPSIIVHDPYGSFPSSHAAFFAALAVTMWMTDRRVGWWFVGAAVLIAVARVGAGIHFPLDILAGAVIGALFGMVVERFILLRSHS
jgi:undecaprenyl-diphosphatase